MDNKDSCYSFLFFGTNTNEILTRNILQVAPSRLCFCSRGMHPIFVLHWLDT
jgi:hypothetical protein